MFRASILIRGNQMIPVLNTHYRFLCQPKPQLKPDPVEKCYINNKTNDGGKNVVDSQIVQKYRIKQQAEKEESVKKQDEWEARLFAYLDKLFAPGPREQQAMQWLKSGKIPEKIREITKEFSEKITTVKEKTLKQLSLRPKEVASQGSVNGRCEPEQMKDSWLVVKSSEISGHIKKGWKEVQASESYKIVEHKLSREQLKLLPGQAMEQWQIFQTTHAYKAILDSPQTFIKYYGIALVKGREYWIIFMKSEFKDHLVEVSLWTYSKAKGYVVKIAKFVREAYFEEPQPLKIKKAKKSDSNSH